MRRPKTGYKGSRDNPDRRPAAAGRSGFRERSVDRGSFWENIKKALEDFALDFIVFCAGLAGGIGGVMYFFVRRNRRRMRRR